MMLGDILAQARTAALLDDALRGEIEAAGEAPEGYPARALSDFERFASEEDWATLISHIRRAEDPAAACVEAMVRWRLSAPGCKLHQHAG